MCRRRYEFAGFAVCTLTNGRPGVRVLLNPWDSEYLIPGLETNNQGFPSMSKRIITVGHSPDPDDAFMFYALAHDKIDTGNLAFRHELQDIETLNRRALKGELDVS